MEVTRRGPALGWGVGIKAPRHLLLGAGGRNGRGATLPNLMGGGVFALDPRSPSAVSAILYIYICILAFVFRQCQQRDSTKSDFQDFGAQP